MLYSSQEIESRQEVERDHETSKPASSDPLASARLYFLRFLELFKTVSPAGDRVLKQMSQWGNISHPIYSRKGTRNKRGDKRG